MAKTEITVKGIRLEVDTERIGPMELPTVVQLLEDKMKDISLRTNTVDTLKLAFLAAMEFAMDVYLKGQNTSAQKRDDTQALDEMILKLQSVLEASLPEK